MNIKKREREKNPEQKHRVAERLNVNTTYIRKFFGLNFGSVLECSKGFLDLPQSIQPMPIQYIYQVTLSSF
jgi:hypothetical protein